MALSALGAAYATVRDAVLSIAVVKLSTTVDPLMETLEGVILTPLDSTVNAETGAVA